MSSHRGHSSCCYLFLNKCCFRQNIHNIKYKDWYYIGILQSAVRTTQVFADLIAPDFFSCRNCTMQVTIYSSIVSQFATKRHNEANHGQNLYIFKDGLKKAVGLLGNNLLRNNMLPNKSILQGVLELCCFEQRGFLKIQIGQYIYYSII